MDHKVSDPDFYFRIFGRLRISSRDGQGTAHSNECEKNRTGQPKIRTYPSVWPLWLMATASAVARLRTKTECSIAHR